MVEFAALRLENGKIKDEFQTLINPEQHIRKSSYAIHGISQEMVADAPTEAEAIPQILEFIEIIRLLHITLFLIICLLMKRLNV